MLCSIYIFNVFAVGYIVYAVGKFCLRVNLTVMTTLERAHGTCMLYGDVLWMMGVTITNLGYGDFTPSNYISRIIISILSLLGIVLKN